MWGEAYSYDGIGNLTGIRISNRKKSAPNWKRCVSASASWKLS